LQTNKGGRGGRTSGHILNIIDGFINGIILMVTPSAILSVSMSRHCNFIGNDVYKNLHVIVLFGFFIPSIPLGFPQYISIIYFCRCLQMELAMDKFGW